MKSIGNQKKIEIVKEIVDKGTGKNRPYMIAYTDTIELAAKELNNTQFKVYIYLLTNQDGYYFGLSPQDIANRYGASIDAVRDAIKGLIDKGYLVQEKNSEWNYKFYDRLDKKPIPLPSNVSIKEKVKTFIDEDTGEEIKLTFKQLLEECDGDEELANKTWNGGN